MHRAFVRKFLDLVEADARIYQSGNAWGTAFLGVKRIVDGDAPTENYINLFDVTQEADATSSRPAIYCGSRRLGYSDRREIATISAVRNEHRIMVIPFIIVCHGESRYEAECQVDQIAANLRRIIMDPANLAVSGHWYEMSSPGSLGSADTAVRGLSSSTGSGDGALSVAQHAMPVQFRYVVGYADVTA